MQTATLAAALVLASVLCAPSALAEPSSPAPSPTTTVPSLPPTPVDGSVMVPGMAMGVTPDMGCDGTPFFGLTPEGRVVACVYGGAENRSWTASAPLIGVRIKGSSCASEGDYVAMSPQGEGMLCTVPSITLDQETGYTESVTPVWTPAS